VLSQRLPISANEQASRRAEIDLDDAYPVLQGSGIAVTRLNSPKDESQSNVILSTPDLESRWRFKRRGRSVAPDLRRSGRIASHLHPDPKRTMRMNAAVSNLHFVGRNCIR
jgi:hypothetical protein